MTQEAKRLKEFRQKIGLTQIQLAQELSVGQDTISRYENGSYAIPIDVIKHLYIKYKLNYIWFFHGFGKSKVDEIAKATLTTDLKEVLLENSILKEKVKILEDRFERITLALDQRIDKMERLQP